MKPINILTEYLKEPIGIDISSPRINWNCVDGKKQTAYQIIAKENGTVLMDTGKVFSSSMYFDFPISFSSRQKINFAIILWDENDEKGEKSTSSFEMGLLSDIDWKASWITGNYHPRKNERYPVDCFKKIFEISSITKARMYISACGIYEARLNDQRVGDFIFAPGSTDYHKGIQYQTYDITSLLKNGKNEFTLELADGWYRGSNGAKGRTNTYGKETKFICQMEILQDDGNVSYILSDESFLYSNDGEISFADLKDGEIVNANHIPSYSGHAKKTNFHANLHSSNNVFVKENEKIIPISASRSKTGKLILDFGQNISGYICFSLMAKKNDKIHIRLGELLDQNGDVDLTNVQCIHQGKRTPLQEIDYTCKEGQNDYKTKFFYGGFRYAEIISDLDLDKDDFRAIAVYSGFEETSSFECSNVLINQLYGNTLWSLKSNSTDIPSDCPTRERMGWTGDSQIFFNTASFMTNYASFARKHIKDIYDRQWKSGRLPQIAPFANEDWFMWTMNGSVGWACAGIYIPLYFYRKYGDKRILEKYYEGMIRYANFMIKRAGKWGGIYAKHVPMSHKNRKYFVNCGQSYGEWAEPSDVCIFKWTDFAGPHPEESTAYTYFTLKRVLEVAEILGKKDDRLKKIEEYSLGAKRAYQELVTKKNFTLDTDRQAKLVRPLYMGLLDEKQEEYAKKRLIEALNHYSWRLGTGFLSTPMILYVLSGINVDYAYKLLENEEMPGWLYMPKMGATTIWESWEGNSTPSKGIASLNHYSKGAVCEWLLDSMCGLNIDGENHFLFHPQIGGNITYAKMEYQSIYGLVKCGWKKKEEKTVFKVHVPCNTGATVLLDDRKVEIASGEYEFEF